jgi:hypothetical protein
VWDGLQVERELQGTETDLLRDVLTTDVSHLDTAFQVGNRPLRELLHEIQASLRVLLDQGSQNTEDGVCARTIAALDLDGDRPTSIPDRLTTAAQACALLGEIWSSVAEKIELSLRAMSRMDAQRLAEVRSLLRRELGDQYKQEFTSSPCLRARRHSLLAATLLLEDRDALLTMHEALEALGQVEHELAERLRCHVRQQIAEVLHRLDSFELVRKPPDCRDVVARLSLPLLVSLAETLRTLESDSGPLDRAELALYRYALRGRSGRRLRHQLRQLDSTVRQGRPDRIRTRHDELESVLADEGIGQNDQHAVDAVKILRCLA